MRRKSFELSDGYGKTFLSSPFVIKKRTQHGCEWGEPCLVEAMQWAAYLNVHGQEAEDINPLRG
jgi:hypothetical protein